MLVFCIPPSTQTYATCDKKTEALSPFLTIISASHAAYSKELTFKVILSAKKVLKIMRLKSALDELITP
jgi:hypothetical protein